MVSVSGCRGITGKSLTPDTAARYIRAFLATIEARNPRIVLGRDGRAGGAEVARWAADALRAHGSTTTDIAVATTPTIGRMVRELRADAGIAITASHNPGEWNGIKPITREGRAPAAAEAARIVAMFHAEHGPHSTQHAARTPDGSPTAGGSIDRDDSAVDRHVAAVLTALERTAPLARLQKRAFRVVLDSVNASGARPGKRLLEALGCGLTHMNASDSGVFPHTPEPTRENLIALCATVREAGADIGFAQDPDADRLAIVDDHGEYIGEEYTLVLAVMGLLGAMKPEDARGVTLAANLSTSRMIDDVADHFGARVLRSPVGEAHVVDAMVKHRAPIGGEGNGGVIWPEVVPIRDSLGAMALVLALLARADRPLSAIVAGLPRYAIVKRKVDIREGMADRAMLAAESALPAGRTDRQDGVRIDFDDPAGGQAWVHVRASNTEPILRLIAEAPTHAAAEAALDAVQAAMRA